MSCFRIAAVTALFLASVWAEAPGRKTIDLILGDAGAFDVGNAVPGVLRLHPATACPLLANKEGKVFAALGQGDGGRVAAFAHGSFLKASLLQDKNAAEVVGNSIRWAGKSSSPVVGLSKDTNELKSVLTNLGMRVETVEPAKLVDQVDVYCFIGHEQLSPEDRDALKKFSLKGGGIVTATTPWAFAKNYPNFAEFPANQVASLAGIEFEPNGYVSVEGTVAPEFFKMLETSPVEAARALMDRGERSPDMIAALEQGKALAGQELRAFLPVLHELDRKIGPIVPTQDKPFVPGQDPLADAVLKLLDYFNQNLPADMILPLPAAADYPGRISEGAARVSRELTLSGSYKGWLTGRNAGAWAAKELRPTGLYAAPGEIVTVTVPDEIAGSGFEVVVGTYRGNLDNRGQWRRWPHLQRRFDIRDRETLAANGLGGLITIAVPRGADFGELSVRIDNAVEAPLYVHGQTSVSEWRSEIRNHPAPWAELVSDRMIIALPSDQIRNLRNPDEVMEMWNEIIDVSADLVQVDRDAYRAERLAFERQPAAGYMHSGYPVAAPLDKSVTQAVDANALRSDGNWGFFHEYGHNHQHDLWALPGTVETTCNLWSVYVFEELIGKDREDTHGGVNPLRRQQRRNAYFDNGRNFQADWNVWTALDTYLLIQEEFGWEPFKKVFDEYNKLPQSEWPKTQQEKNDQWVIRLSKACGKNLAPYWRAWNLPLSDSVFEELSDLPEWEGHPVERYLK